MSAYANRRGTPFSLLATVLRDYLLFIPPFFELLTYTAKDVLSSRATDDMVLVRII